jgi:hypothetical protein
MDVRKTWAGRVVFAALVVMLVAGLWQGYGAWLLGGAGTHGS